MTLLNNLPCNYLVILWWTDFCRLRLTG